MYLYKIIEKLSVRFYINEKFKILGKMIENNHRVGYYLLRANMTFEIQCEWLQVK